MFNNTRLTIVFIVSAAASLGLGLTLLGLFLVQLTQFSMATFMMPMTPEERGEYDKRKAFSDTPEKDRYYDKLLEMLRTPESEITDEDRFELDNLRIAAEVPMQYCPFGDDCPNAELYNETGHRLDNWSEIVMAAGDNFTFEELTIEEQLIKAREQTAAPLEDIKEMAETAFLNGTCLDSSDRLKILRHPDTDVSILGTEIPNC